MTRQELFNALPIETYLGNGQVNFQVNEKHVRVKTNCAGTLFFYKVTASDAEIWLGFIDADFLISPNNSYRPNNQKECDKNLFFDAVGKFMTNECLQKELILNIQLHLINAKEDLEKKIAAVNRDLLQINDYCQKAVKELDERFNK